MFRHDKCGGYVFPVQTIQIRCGLTLTPRGISIVGVGKINRIASKGKVTLSCNKCENEVPVDQVVTNCMQCGEEFKLKELFVLLSCSGVYCRSCCDTFYPGQDRIIAATAMSKTID